MDSGVTGVRGPLVVKHAIVGYRLELVYAITPLSRPEEKTVKVRHQKQSPVWIVIVQVSLYNGSYYQFSCPRHPERHTRTRVDTKACKIMNAHLITKLTMTNKKKTKTKTKKQTS